MASITKRPDGKWRARYRDREGKEHARHFPRKVDATKWLNDTTTNITTGLWVDPKHSRDTVEGMAATWLASNPDWTVSTRVRNESIVELHILPRWGRVRLVDVTTEAIQEWTGSFTLAGGTVRKIVGVLSGILALAVTLKRLAVNTATPVKLPKQSLGRRKYLTAVQVERMADGARDYSDVVLVLAYCGLRFGEMAALRVGNVDQLRRRFMIEESVTEVKGRMEWSTPKDHQRRSVPFPDFLDDAITARMEDKGPRDLLFPSRKGEVMRIGNARRDWFDPAALSAGLDGLTPHELRHTAASLTVATGASVLALQRMLGHDKPSTTLDVYSDLYDEDLDQIPERLASVRSRALADYLRTGPQLVPVPQVS